MEELNLKKVFTDKKDYPLSTIKEMFEEGDIIPQPDYQRDYIMDNKKASKLIESVLLQIPIPTVYLCEEKDGTFSIIDGQQRLTSFVKFLKNEIELRGLEEYPEYNGKRFMDLEKDMQRLIKSTTINCIVIQKESQELKYEIFSRLNQGSTSLKPQELRNCIYRGSFNDMLEEIAKTNKNLAFLVGDSNKRKNYQEYVLRYFALKNFQEYSSSISRTLNLCMEKHQNDSEESIKQYKKEYDSNIDIIRQVLGQTAFCGYDRIKGKIMNKFSGSVYDSIVIGFSMFNNHDLMSHSDSIRESINNMKMNDDEYQEYTYAATGSKARVIGRIMKVYELLANIIGKRGDYGVERTFSKETKEELWHEGYICPYCNNVILNIDDAEVDHIEAFVSGGETVKENAQLLHRHCNRKKHDNDIEFENEEAELTGYPEVVKYKLDLKEFKLPNREYWENRCSKEVMKKVDAVFEDIKGLAEGYELKYNKYYIGVAKNGVARNFMVFKPKPKRDYFYIEIKGEYNPEKIKRIEDTGLKVSYLSWEAYKIRIHDFNEYEKNRELIGELLTDAIKYCEID